MNAQQRFHHYLVNAQGLCTNPEKMPYLCIIGTHDFDELKAGLALAEVFRDFRTRVDTRIAHEWDPLNTSDKHFEAFRERVEQEEFSKEPLGLKMASSSPVVAEAESGLDSRQLQSLTDCLEFCGCKCFRSLSEARGFWFA